MSQPFENAYDYGLVSLGHRIHTLTIPAASVAHKMAVVPLMKLLSLFSLY